MAETGKHPGGRPSNYNPAYCDRIQELAQSGCSVAEWAADLGVARGTLYDWAEQHEEFSAAFTRAKSIEQSWWERKGRESLDKAPFQAAVWKTSMQARFRDDYTERKELTGKDGGALQITIAKADADLL